MFKRALIHSTSIFAIPLIAACSNLGQPNLNSVANTIYSGQCVEKSNTEITIYSGRTENLIQPVLDAFVCTSGIEVAVRWGSSTDLALLLAEEGSQNEVDVFLSRSPGPVGFLESEGLLRTLHDKTLEMVEPQNRSAQKTWVGFSGRKRVLVYNIDAISPAELPKSIFELTDKRFKAEVAIPATNGSFIDWFTVFRDQYGDAAATKWLNDMVANEAKFYPNNRSIVEASGRGEIQLGMVNHYYNFQQQMTANENHRAANHNLSEDDIGSLLIITAATVLRESANSEQANTFIQYLLSAPVQRYFTEETFEYPLASDVEPASILPPLKALGAGSINYDTLGGGFEETTKIIESSGILSQ